MTAKAMRYHINTAKLPFFKYSSKYLIAKNPKIVEETTPHIKAKLRSDAVRSFAANKNAPIMAGVPNKKEKRAADSRLRPSARPASIVMPDLETPGIRASD